MSEQAKQISAIELKPGMTYLTHYGPRVINSVRVEREHGRDWLIWRWTRAPRTDGIDCGFGGVWLSEAGTTAVAVSS